MKVLYSFSIVLALWIPQQSAARGRGGGVGGFRGGGGTHFAPPATGLAAGYRKPDCHPYKRVEVVAGVDGEECKRIPGGSRRTEGVGHCQPRPRVSPQRITQVTENSMLQEAKSTSEPEAQANPSLQMNSTSSSSAPPPTQPKQDGQNMNNEIMEDDGNQFNVTEVVIECVCEWVIECMENGAPKPNSQISSLPTISAIFLSTLNFYL